MHRTSAGRQLPEDGDAVGLLLMGFAQRVQTGQEIGKQRLNKLETRLVWQTPLLFHNAEESCRGGVHGDDFVVVGLRRALDRMGKPHLASTPCENHTDLVLGITVNAALSC